MSYPLKSLHQLLCVHLTPKNEMFTKPVPVVIKKSFDKAMCEIDALQVSILESIIEADSFSAQSATVKACQVGCTSSLNGIYHQRRKLHRMEGAAVGWEALYEEMEKGLLVFLQYIHDHLPSLFDKTQPLPLALRERYQQEYRKRSKALEEELKRAELGRDLQHLILKPLLGFLSSAEVAVTYIAMDYIESYLEKMEIMVSIGEARADTWIDTLIEMDNNDPAFVKYLAQKLRAEEEEQGQPAEKLAMWSAQRSRFNTLHCYSASAFHSHLPSAKEVILGFIGKEIDNLLKELQVGMAWKTVAPNSAAPPEPGFITSLSMTQIAVMLRLFYDCLIIKSESQTAIFKAITNAIRTDKTARLSADSLRSKYYSPERAAINIIQDRLFQMLNHLKQM